LKGPEASINRDRRGSKSLSYLHWSIGLSRRSSCDYLPQSLLSRQHGDAPNPPSSKQWLRNCQWHTPSCSFDRPSCQPTSNRTEPPPMHGLFAIRLSLHPSTQSEVTKPRQEFGFEVGKRRGRGAIFCCVAT
jgi:hypothetical protein